MRLHSVAALTVLLAACAGEQSAEPTTDTHATAPGFVQLVDAYFMPSCGALACHGDTNGAAGLTFADAEAAYEHLLEGVPVNAEAAVREWGLVVPEDAARSYLVQKLVMSETELSGEGLGARMPIGGAGAPGPSTLAAIEAWIEAGAPFDGQGFEADTTTNEDGSTYINCNAADVDGLRDCFGDEPDSDEIVRYYSDPITVPAQSEIVLCTYMEDTTVDPLSFRSFRALQMTGGHHSALYMAFQPEAPGLRECTGAAMTNLRILAGAFSGTDGLVPDDVRLDLPAGRQVVVQSHYINPTSEPVTVMDAVELELTTAEESPMLADSFVLNMGDFEVPVGAIAHPHGNGDGCRIGRPLSVHSVQLHMHEHGSLMELWHTPEGGEPALLFSETDGIKMREGAAALLLDPPFELAPEDRLSVRCEWDNDTEHPLTFPEEMCAAFMYYTPGEGFLLCDDDASEPEVLGAGSPGDGCVAPGAQGNELGVGRQCTADGSECLNNGEATLCLATFDARANFCSLFGCETDEDCGTGAGCHAQALGSACVPDQCRD